MAACPAGVIPHPPCRLGAQCGGGRRPDRGAQIIPFGAAREAPALGTSGAPEDGLAFLGEGVQAFEIVGAVVSLPAQTLDAFVHLRRDGLVVRKDTELGTDAGEPMTAFSVPVAAGA